MRRNLYSKIEDGTWDDAKKIVFCPSKVTSEKIKNLVQEFGYSSYKNLLENAVDSLYKNK